MESVSGYEWTEAETTADAAEDWASDDLMADDSMADDLVAEFEAIDENEADAAGEAIGWDSLMEYQPWAEYETLEADETTEHETPDEDYGDWEEDWGDNAEQMTAAVWGEDDEQMTAAVWGEGDERAEELERERQFEVLAIPREVSAEYDLPELPAGIAIMDGTARSVARRLVAGDTEPARDLHLVHIPELNTSGTRLSSAELDEISKVYAPDSYMHGREIPTAELENYFLTRDFTIDQCLIYQDKLMLTRAAYDDLQENIIRPSHHMQPTTAAPLSERRFLQALMLRAELATTLHSYPVLEDFGLEQIDETIAAEADRGEKIRLGAPDVALTLNQAMNRGAEVAQGLTAALAEYGVVAEHYRGRPLLLAREARDQCYDFEYRPNDGWTDATPDEGLEDELVNLVRHPVDKHAGRKALQEYESYFQIKERTAGPYPPAEYEWVNRN